MDSFQRISQTNYFQYLLRIKFQKKYSISNTGDLAKLLVLKANARVLIITNIDVSGRLINEQAGIFKHIETKEKIEQIIYLALDDTFAGRTRINGNDIIAKIYRYVPIERGQVSIYLSECKTTSSTIQRA